MHMHTIIYVYVYIYTHTHAWEQFFLYTCIYTDRHTHPGACFLVYMYIHRHRHTPGSMLSCIYASHTHTHTHTHTREHVFLYICLLTQTHTHTWEHLFLSDISAESKYMAIPIFFFDHFLSFFFFPSMPLCMYVHIYIPVCIQHIRIYVHRYVRTIDTMCR